MIRRFKKQSPAFVTVGNQITNHEPLNKRTANQDV